jgi:dolichol-phosphate mannosyltransferase
MKKLIIIPTYNEKENIEKLISEILKQDKDIDVLIVDDNSPDGTGAIVDELKKKNPRINILHRKGKLGLGSAYILGFKYALKHQYGLIFQMDADFSHNPKYLPKLIFAAQKYDLVLGSRLVRGGGVVGWPRIRYFTSRSANLFSRTLLGLKPHDVTTGFRCYNKRVLEKINLDGIVCTGYAFLEELIYLTQKSGFSIGEIPIVFVDRKLGKSKMGLKEIISSAKAVIKLSLSQKSKVKLRQNSACPEQSRTGKNQNDNSKIHK